MTDTGQPHHPAPHRHKASWLLGVALLAAPLAWLAQTSANYGLSSHACYPADEPFLSMQADWPWPTALAVVIFAIAISAAATLVVLATWRRTWREAAGDASDLIEAGEGRTRFLSMWGTMSNAGFTLALVFSLIALLGVPPCGYP